MVKHWEKWSDSEERFLIKNAQNMTAEDMAKVLKRSVASINSKVRYYRKLGKNIRMQKSGDNHHLARHKEHDVELCRMLSLEGMTGEVISEKMEIPLGTVYDWISYQSRKEPI